MVFSRGRLCAPASRADEARFDWIRPPVKDYRHHIGEFQRASAVKSAKIRFLRMISGRDIPATVCKGADDA
jgi:hypothetical protein